MVQVTRALGRAAASPATAAAQPGAPPQAVVGFLAEAARARAVKAATEGARALQRAWQAERTKRLELERELGDQGDAGAEARVLAAEARALGGLKFQNGRARASSTPAK